MRLPFLLATLASALVATAAAAHEGIKHNTVIFAGSVIVDPDQPPLGPSTIEIEDGRIVQILAGHDDSMADHDTHFFDLGGKTVLAGLIDLHTHLSSDPSGEYWRAATTPPEYYVLLAAKNARRSICVT